MSRKTTRPPVKVSGWFFYVDLLTKHKNECKQRQKEQTKGHYILKIEMIFHRHHPHSFRMRSTHPVTRLFHNRILSYYPPSYNSLFLFIKYLFTSYAQSHIRHDKNFYLFVTYVLVTCQLPTYFHNFLYCFMTSHYIKEPLKILHFQGF